MASSSRTIPRPGTKGSPQSQLTARSVVDQQVPSGRREEIERYLRLFGYKPERTILQVHVAGTLGRRAPQPIESQKRRSVATRYGGNTFTVVGRSHDPSLVGRLVPPRKTEGANPGYLGYLFAAKDQGGRPPHELLPLDFVPNGMVYPGEWKTLYRTPGYLITMHVPASFAPYKNELLRRLRRIGGAMDVRKVWTFFDELEEYGFDSRKNKKREDER